MVKSRGGHHCYENSLVICNKLIRLIIFIHKKCMCIQNVYVLDYCHILLNKVASLSLSSRKPDTSLRPQVIRVKFKPIRRIFGIGT